MKRAEAVAVALTLILLAGCSSTGTRDADSVSPSAAVSSPAANIAPNDIDSVETASQWAQDLDDSAIGAQVAEGIERILPLVHESGVPTIDANRISRDLLSLQIDVLDSPDTATSRLPELIGLIDELAAS
ncbi:hypothetical protein [Microbacterium imperiale]|uniref:Uncharacterized protein n=1 Tax=Microbacterium imperiale TaxID=33884 RepID=A0A9W6HG47_9MICO|nr:hypothetical protein [Microbacterium imperiale]MBP2422063.1 putative lipoprotein [Microbacterium imperiale]MDS0200220.1 hypothetical protein [Microbacterium imperiale]BFE39371.1 hypothetical protein GCM10017544_03270 [Microbacterium imperiale]GLJ79762.1 hypothetical protein GCM10017586_14440 [Microbacterium imperiale]